MSKISKAQIWVIIFLSFIIILTVVVGGYAYGFVSKISDIVNAPASTSTLDVSGNFTLRNELSPQANLEIDKIHLEANSKIIDLIIFFLKEN